MKKENDIYSEAFVERFADYLFLLIEKYSDNINLDVHNNTDDSG